MNNLSSYCGFSWCKNKSFWQRFTCTGQGISELSFNATSISAEDVGSCATTTGSNSHFNAAGLALVGTIIDTVLMVEFPPAGILFGIINTIVYEMGSADEYSDDWATCVKDMINMVIFFFQSHTVNN